MAAKYRIGLLQYNIIWEDISANLNYISNFLSNLESFPDLIVLPEMLSTGFTMNPDNLDSAWLDKQFSLLQNLSNKHRIGIIGSLVACENNAFFNRLCFFSPKDSFQYYNKRHLFRMGGESQVYSMGNDRKILTYKDLNIFPQICYDLRFPVWSRNNLNYHLLINVANWPAARQDVWLTLLKARAIENQCYVVGVNRTGSDMNEIDYVGGSVAYNAKGETLCLFDDKERYQVLEIDLLELNQFRNIFPVHKDADHFEIKNRE